MREILFRGKRTKDGEWVEGSLLIDEYDRAGKTEKYYRIIGCTYGDADDNGLLKYQLGFDEEVDRDTVGQFTGLYDDRGRKIFEGDILVHHSFFKDHFAVIKYGEFNCSCCQGVYGWSSTSGYVDIRDLCDDPSELPKVRLEDPWNEVVGNIWDNPELIQRDGEAR